MLNKKSWPEPYLYIYIQCTHGIFRRAKQVGLARTIYIYIYIRCTHGILGRKNHQLYGH